MNSLVGRTVVLTRSPEDCEEWAANLSRWGVEALSLPCIETYPLASPGLGNRVRESLTSATWLLLTSQRAVRVLSDLLDRSSDVLPGGLKIAVVGPATANECSRLLGEPRLVASGGTASSLCDDLLPDLSAEDRVLAAMSQRSDDRLELRFRSSGVSFERIDIYSTEAARPVASGEPLPLLEAEVVFLASPSALEGLLHQRRLRPGVRLVSIGPSTSAAIVGAGFSVFSEASERSLEGLMASYERALSPTSVPRQPNPQPHAEEGQR